MKKISVVLIFILAFLFAPAVHAEVQNTLSDEILVQAKAQADLFLELKNALGLDWLDKYNAYLQNPASKPVPTWDTSISSLINKGYLSATFPTDFAVSISGNEAQISRNISSQAVRDAVKIYIPSATVSGNTVKLLVQRPAQWVAYESALNGKVSRDGSDSPDVLPGAQLDFGSRASINFISNDGKILGVNSLTYKGEELDTRFINASGDNMTGDLTIKGNKAWHAGNDGSGSGLDADLLDGKDSTYFTNASNLASGIVPVERLSGTYSIDISGNAATATNANYATSAGNADTVDGKHASDFALSGHTHGQYVQKTGDTMTGNLTLQGTSINIQRPDTSGGYARGMMFYSKDGSAVEAGIGMLGSGNNPPQALYMGFGISPWSSSAGLTVTPTDITFKNNKVWHAGNDGSGSGLDADMVDGYSTSQTPSANKIVVSNSNGKIDPGWLDIDIAQGYANTVDTVSYYNLHGQDYDLQPGEVAKINFSNATSVPLRIKTYSGTSYKFYLIPSNAGGTSGSIRNPIFLYPNGMTYSNQFKYIQTFYRMLKVPDDGIGEGEVRTYSAFRIGYAFSSSEKVFTNYTQYKDCYGTSTHYGDPYGWPTIHSESTVWRNTTTAWTSFGTVVFPAASSGTILVERIK